MVPYLLKEFVEALEKVNQQAESEHPISWLKGQDQTIPCSLVSKELDWSPPVSQPSSPLLSIQDATAFCVATCAGVHSALQNGTPVHFCSVSIHQFPIL